MKKILLLGGSFQQLIAIKTAKDMGLYTILCDYLEDNPGQYEADKFYLASTTDKEKILEIAQKENIDGILAYASDPAAPTAAYVAEEMRLPGNPYKSVDILCNKDKFREFLSKNGFNTPKAKGYDNKEKAFNDIKENYFKLPLIVKPVDSSGSKGVAVINSLDDSLELMEKAFNYSRNGRIILEEYVEKFGYQVAGDGLSVEGKLIFRDFANDHFDEKCKNPFVPISASFPYDMPLEIHQKIHDEIQKLLSLLNMGTCTYNFDIRIDKDYSVYLMEIAPRDGGNYIPDIIKYRTGVNLVEASIRAALDLPIELNNPSGKGYYAYYAVHSYEDGILEKINITEEVIKNNIIENRITKKKGDKISAFTGANTTLGILLMQFNSMEEMLDMMDNSEKWINIEFKK